MDPMAIKGAEVVRLTMKDGVMSAVGGGDSCSSPIPLEGSLCDDHERPIENLCLGMEPFVEETTHMRQQQITFCKSQDEARSNTLIQGSSACLRASMNISIEVKAIHPLTFLPKPLLDQTSSLITK